MSPMQPVTRLAILAVAEPRHGGTLPYTLSMIDALRRLPASAYCLTIITNAGNDQYDKLDLPVVKIASVSRFLAEQLTGKGPFADVDKIVAPVYSTLLLATSRPFMFTLHDLQEKHFPEHFSRATRIWRHATNRLLTARARRIVCESRFVRDDIIRCFGVPQDRIAVVPAPPTSDLVDIVPDAAAMAVLRQRFDLPGDFVFYPAQFWPHKNHRRLVEAFARIADAHPGCSLVLTGQQRLEFEAVMRRAAELGISHRLRHVGHIALDEMSALYRMATVVAVPTLFESISLPVYEAFSVGTAVCASNVVALPEQVGDAGLLFDPLSVEDIAACLSRLLASPDLRRRLVQRGHAQVASVTHADYARNLARIIDAL